MKSKTKSVLLVGVCAANYSGKVKEDFEHKLRKTIGLSKKKLPIVVYDKNAIDITLMDIPR